MKTENQVLVAFLQCHITLKTISTVTRKDLHVFSFVISISFSSCMYIVLLYAGDYWQVETLVEVVSF